VRQKRINMPLRGRPLVYVSIWSPASSTRRPVTHLDASKGSKISNTQYSKYIFHTKQWLVYEIEVERKLYINQMSVELRVRVTLDALDRTNSKRKGADEEGYPP
jgi:hypothetical protein